MRISGSSRRPTVAPAAGVPPSPSWPRTLRRGWWALPGWPAQIPAGYGPTGSSDRQPKPAMRVGRSVQRPVPSIFPPAVSVPAATTGSAGGRPEQELDTGSCARLPALIATLPSPDREIVLLRVVAGVPIPDIVAALGVTPTAIALAEHQALAALQPKVTTTGSPPSVTRVQVVLLPHAPTEPPDTRPTNRRAGTANGMDHNESPRHRAFSDTTRAITASRQWHDAELAMRQARHSFDRWLAVDHRDPPSLAIVHAHHTRAAVQKAARVIVALFETLDAEATALITTPTQRTNIPTQRR
jgi:sigma-70-like protein